MSKIIVITSGKGGTGKSTVCVSLGTSLAKRGKRVLLIDCDSGMRGLDLMLGVSKGLVFDIADAVSGNCKTEHTVYPCSHINGLFLIPAPQSAGDEVSPSVLNQFVESVKNSYDYILIDSPAGVGKGFEAAITPSELCLVVANAEPTSMRGCVNVRKRLKDKEKTNIRLVINRFNSSVFWKQGFYKDLDEVINEAGIQLVAIVPECNQLTAAIQKGTAYSGSSKAIIAFDNLAARIDGERVPLLIH